eukprot:TRINITY_DN50589_c0_g1_i1.p1 TRINITY_DN50589_c0_g1~~TRINITY_DN50589_c0_g1_i1.p1  ORF type:complete len:683 (+),score=109.26 TRINITY_DN50589_c0_g1_i1:39-2087(+)
MKLPPIVAPMPNSQHSASDSLAHDFHKGSDIWHATNSGQSTATSFHVEPRAAGFEALEWEESEVAVPKRDVAQECIKVAARFRPLSEAERLEGEGNICVDFGSNGQTCTMRASKVQGVSENKFAFDHIFQPESSQADVYCTVARPIVEGVINGFNGAIIAYGQTGSGKTHTMLGPSGAQAFVQEGDIDVESLGVIPRALQDLLDYASPTEGLVQLRASYVETYNEHVIDLLSPVKGGSLIKDQVLSSAAMREQAEVLYLPTVTETPIRSVREALEVMRTGNKNRHQAETKMNRHSSRSHAVFIVTVTNSLDKARQKFAQLYLVDLAGSERVGKTGVEGTQLQEAKNINKSLLALGQVIWALAHKQKHIPYRDSKLTQLLRNCLGGNARTAIMIAASPHIDNAGESLSALRFGARASLVENSAHENVAEDASTLKKMLEKARQDLNDLRAHCRRLQCEVAAYKAADSLAAPDASDQLQTPSGSEGPLQNLTARKLFVWGLLPSLVCPIGQAIMRDPVLAADGWTYERTAIERHITRAGRLMPVSPVTGCRLSTRQVMPNLVVKQLVRNHMPDLGPPEVPLPMFLRLHCWHVHIVLSFLDARSLARCECAWSSFVAASVDSKAWQNLLALNFEAQATDAEPMSARSARSRYAHLKLATSIPLPASVRNTSISKGLKLFRAKVKS